MFLRSRKGFTILELLIVIAVIAILVGIALPRFKGMQDEGNIAKAKGELRTLQTAVESYIMHNAATPPAALSDLIAATTVPSIVKVLPTDPFNAGNDYGYLVNSSYYAIWSVGPNANGLVASVNATTGALVETNGSSCIFVTNGTPNDTTP